MKVFFLLISFLTTWLSLSAQEMPDTSGISTNNADTVKRIPVNEDSLRYIKAEEKIQYYKEFISSNEYTASGEEPVVMPMIPSRKESDDLFFYLIMGLLVFFGIIRIAWPRYMENMGKLLRGSVRNQQLRDQMQQNSQPALLLNILYLVNMAMFLNFLAEYLGWFSELEFAKTYLYSLALVTGLFLAQLIFLKSSGWLFNISSATDAYIFIVSLIKKITGIILLPVLMLLAFSGATITEITLKGFGIIICLLILYRVLISFRIIKNQIKITWLHFFLYLCAFEVAPVLLVYKVLLNLMETN